MDIIFSFDSEDYLTPEAADGEKWWAEELTRRGLRGSFQLVTEMVRSLARRDRSDVIEAIRRHEVGFHTSWHSLPPTHPEAIEGLSLAEGVRWVLRTEAEGWGDLIGLFERVPISYCPPGDSWTPATLLAMAALGVKVGSGFPVHAATNPFWYCGLLCLGYDLAFDSFMAESPDEEQRFKTAFEEMARGREGGVLTVFTHPARLMTARFWDHVFYKGARPPADQRPPAPLRAPEHVRMIEDRMRRLLDWIQARPGVRFSDYATVHAARAAAGRDLPVLLGECGLKAGEQGRLPLRESKRAPCLSAQAVDAFRYAWPVYAEGFSGPQLHAQMRGLLWTSAAA